MPKDPPPVSSAADALLYLDFMARYGDGQFGVNCGLISQILREFMRRVETQAMRIEQCEAVIAGRKQ